MTLKTFTKELIDNVFEKELRNILMLYNIKDEDSLNYIRAFFQPTYDMSITQLKKVIQEIRIYCESKFPSVSTEPNYYTILGVDKNADCSEISKHWKQIAFSNHPDKTGHETEERRRELSEIFTKATNAYDALCDNKESSNGRADYDKKLTKVDADCYKENIHYVDFIHFIIGRLNWNSIAYMDLLSNVEDYATEYLKIVYNSDTTLQQINKEYYDNDQNNFMRFFGYQIRMYASKLILPEKFAQEVFNTDIYTVLHQTNIGYILNIYIYNFFQSTFDDSIAKLKEVIQAMRDHCKKFGNQTLSDWRYFFYSENQSKDAQDYIHYIMFIIGDKVNLNNMTYDDMLKKVEEYATIYLAGFYNIDDFTLQIVHDFYIENNNLMSFNGYKIREKFDKQNAGSFKNKRKQIHKHKSRHISKRTRRSQRKKRNE
jgi:curved DNA-binding protein CbpA